MSGRRPSALILAMCLVGLCIQAYARQAQHDEDEYEEGLAFLNLNRAVKRVTVVRLDGNTRTYELPMPLGRYTPDGGIDITPWGKMVYVGSYQSGPRKDRRPVTTDDGSVNLLYTGFFCNALNDLIPFQISISPDGSKLALTAKPRGRESKTSPALFCLDLLNGRLVQITGFGDAARGPKWSNKGDKVAFYFGPDQPDMSEHEKLMGLYVVEQPFSGSRRLTELAPPVWFRGHATGSTPPAWAAHDQVIYFDWQHVKGPERGRPTYINRVDLKTKKIETLVRGSAPISDEMGLYVVFGGTGDQEGIFLADNHKQRPRLIAAGELYAPKISPTGKYIYYCVQEGNKRKVIETTTGKTVLQITLPRGAEGQGRWIRIWKGPRLRR